MLSEKQRDIVTEIVNIGVGRGSALLNEMIRSEIELKVPYINIIEPEDIYNELSRYGSENLMAVELQFKGYYSGISNIILTDEATKVLASILTNLDADSNEVEEIKEGVLIEVGNIILNAVMGTMGNMLEANIDYAPPLSHKGNLEQICRNLQSNLAQNIMVCQTEFKVSGYQIKGEIIILYDLGSFTRLMERLEELEA